MKNKFKIQSSMKLDLENIKTAIFPLTYKNEG